MLRKQLGFCGWRVSSPLVMLFIAGARYHSAIVFVLKVSYKQCLRAIRAELSGKNEHIVFTYRVISAPAFILLNISSPFLSGLQVPKGTGAHGL